MNTYEVKLVGKAVRPNSWASDVEQYLANTPRFLERKGYHKVEFFDTTSTRRAHERFNFRTGIELKLDVEANNPTEAYEKAAEKLKRDLARRGWCRGPLITLDTPKGGKIEIKTRHSESRFY